MLARPASALDSDRSLEQFEHTAWTVREGAPPDIWALAQTPDGFLWLGTGSGLYRFDGVKFQKFDNLNPSLRSSNINALFASRTGDLWIGYATGDISRLRNGRATSFKTDLPSGGVVQFAEDREGRVWAATYSGLARYADGQWRKIGAESGFPEAMSLSVAVSDDGAVWAVAWPFTDGSAREAALYRLAPGAERFELSRRSVGPKFLVASPDRRLWIADERGVAETPTTAAGRLVLRLKLSSQRLSMRILLDRDGCLWGTERGRGVFRARLGRAQTERTAGQIERFRTKEGLTSDIAAAIFEDREGDIWIGTNQGLDRFRATNVVREPAITSTASWGYLLAPGPGRSFYLNANRDLYRFDPGRPPRRIQTTPAATYCLAARREGGVWVGSGDGLHRLVNGRLQRVGLPVGAGKAWVVQCAEDPSGALWVAIWKVGQFRLERGEWRRVDTPARLAMHFGEYFAFDKDGRTWMAVGDKVMRSAEGSALQFSAPEKLDVGEIQTLVPTPDGLLVGGDSGVGRFDGHGFRSLRSRQYGVLERISGIAQTRSGETWIYGAHGLVRVRTQDLNLAFEGRGPLSYQLFDFHDGVPGPAQQDTGPGTLYEAWDGRLWLLSNHGVASLDPSHLSRNELAPPVSITALTSAGSLQSPAQSPAPSRDGPTQFPAGTSNLQVDFTALSLAVPERVQIRYRLEGVDRGWINAGDRRQAFYTQLGPGQYRFRVIAANNDGVWNRTGATAVFTIAPTFYQSGWFIMLCVLAALGALYAAYRLRITFVSNLMHQRLGERLRERERIARELHDTLLQGLQGLMLSFRSAAARLPADHAARPGMDRALLRAEEALTEGRQRVEDLRATDVPQELSELLTLAAQKLGADASLKVRMITSGRPRVLHPLVSQELVRIGEEAMVNTLRHAEARSLDICVAYGADRLTVRFSDDGKGIEPDVARDGAPAGHYGLRGMRERALRIQGKFTLASAPRVGAEIRVVVPGKVAYPCVLKRGCFWRWVAKRR